MLMRFSIALPLALSLLVLACLAKTPEEPVGDPPRFEGQTVVVTGANRGIGLAYAKLLTEAGATVIGTARRPDEATELAATGARVMQLDVTDESSVAAFVESLGDQPIDILVNNAGVLIRMEDKRKPDLEAVRTTLDVNLLGPMRVTYGLLDNVLASDKPRIVNISSSLGSIGNNEDGTFLGYRESKAGLNMFTRSLAAEYEDDKLIAIAVHPGWVRTDMGGPEAAVSPEGSVLGMLRLIDRLRLKDSGFYFNGLDGKRLPW